MVHLFNKIDQQEAELINLLSESLIYRNLLNHELSSYDEVTRSLKDSLTGRYF